MKKPLLLPLLFLPMLAWAQCGVAREEGTVNIMVGAKATNCFDTAGFRESFLAGINEGLASERVMREHAARPARSRRPVTNLLRSEAEQPGGRYYGQR